MGSIQSNPREIAHDFIAQNRSASLATVGDDYQPHIAIVYCVVHNDLSIYFTTRAEGRKFENLIKRPTVAMIFSGYKSLRMLQLTGQANRITNQDTERKLLHQLMRLRYDDPALPPPKVDLLKPGVRKEYALFKVTASEMTYVDFETANVGTYKPDFQKII